MGNDFSCDLRRAWPLAWDSNGLARDRRNYRVAVFSTRRSSRKNLAALNATAPDYIDLDGSGLRTQQSNGATSFQPWESFKGWRSAQSVILLDLAASKRVTILPLTALSVSERDVLRGLVASRLGAEKSR